MQSFLRTGESDVSLISCIYIDAGKAAFVREQMKFTFVHNNPIFIIKEWDFEVNVTNVRSGDNYVLKKRQKCAAKSFFAAQGKLKWSIRYTFFAEQA